MDVNQKGRTAIASFTRPNDTTAYAAGDVASDSTTVPTVLTFSGAFGPNSLGFCIINQLVVISSANQATKPDLELWLFDTLPAAQNDNAAYAPTDADLAASHGGGCIGVITIPASAFRAGNATAGAGGNCIADIQNIGMPINSRPTSAGMLYGHVVVRNAYTPVAQEQFTFKLKLLD
jgi:hypothetical protein